MDDEGKTPPTWLSECESFGDEEPFPYENAIAASWLAALKADTVMTTP